MLTQDDKINLIRISMEAEAENYNRYFLFGFVEMTEFFNEKNKEERENVFKFLAETNTLTQRLYLELINFRSEYEEIIA